MPPKPLANRTPGRKSKATTAKVAKVAKAVARRPTKLAHRPQRTKSPIERGPKAAPIATARQVTRNGTSPVVDLNDEQDEVEIPAEPSPQQVVKRRPPPATTPSQRRAAQNLLDALGGPDVVVPRLRAAGQPKADRLADLMSSSDFDRQSFYLNLGTAGLNVKDFTQTLLDVSHASAIARLAMGLDDVAESIRARATDKIIPHGACLGSGRQLKDDEDGNVIPTNLECFACEGSGYILQSAEKEWVELYLELVQLRKNSPAMSFTKNVQNNQLNQMNVYNDLQVADGAPSVDSIIKRADEQRVQLPSASRQLSDGMDRVPVMSGMPEDLVDDTEPVEAEVVNV